MSGSRPAWSDLFSPDRLGPIDGELPPGLVTCEWAWGGSTGQGVKVAIVDSGIETTHPAVGGRVARWAAFTADADGNLGEDYEPHEDLYGHGTACADIVRRLAPDVELASVRVLGPFLRGRGTAFAAGLRWAIDQGYRLVNLSLGSTQKDLFGIFHELADEAYFQDAVLVTAANNVRQESYPSLFSSVISVASHQGGGPYDPAEYYVNPTPPPEFGAWGIDVRAAWVGGSSLELTGNSFAAPHVTGLVARILAKHPELRPYQIKTVLRALARNRR